MGNTLRRRSGRRRKGLPQKGVYTHPGQVPGVLFRIRYQGGPSRGVGVIPQLKKGAMNKIANRLGYIKEGQGVGVIPNSKIDNFARDLVKTVGPGRAMKMVNAQITLRKGQSGGFKKKMVIAKNAIRLKNKVVKVRRQ